MELRDYLRGLRRHWLAVVLMTAVGLVAAFGWFSIQKPIYEATAAGLIQTRTTAGDDSATQSIAPIIDTLAKQKVSTYMEMATWEVVAQGAIDDLGLDTTPNAVFSRISIENPGDTAIMRVTAQGDSPTEAAALAQAWLASLTKTIDQVEGDGKQGSSPMTITVNAAAALPQSPVYPDLQTALLVGGVLGLGVGIAFAMLRTVSDRRIRLSDDVESRTSVPVVGTIPLSDGQGDSRLFDTGAGAQKGSGFAVSEAMRSLRTNLQFMDVDNPPRTIVVTSPVPGDGKSTIACNLATTLALGGRTVVLVDGDLRRSMVAKTMGLPGNAGLSDVLSGRAELTDVLQKAPQAENMFILTAGSVPPNPSEVLGSERMHKLLADLAGYATVIIDAPPLLPVTDGAVLAHQADGALLVASVGKTTYDLVDKSLDTLAKAGGRALGIVLNKAPLRGAGASAYSYEYRREYGDAQAATAASAATSATAKTEAEPTAASDLFPPAGFSASAATEPTTDVAELTPAVEPERVTPQRTRRS